MKLVMVLLYGSAAVEGGFSINKELIIDSMLEEAVVAQNGDKERRHMVAAVRQSSKKERDRAGEKQKCDKTGNAKL